MAAPTLASALPNGPPNPRLLAGNPSLASGPMSSILQTAAVNPTPYVTGSVPSYYSPETWNLPNYTPQPGGDQTLAQFGANAGKLVPGSQTAEQMTGHALAVNGMLPKGMQLQTGDQLVSQDARNQFGNAYYQQYVRPTEEQTKSDLYSQGRGDSTFGGAQLGSLQALGTLQRLQAGEDMANNRYNQYLGLRQSFFGNEGQMAQNANSQNVQRGLGVANLSGQLFGQQQNQKNQFELGRYGLMLQAQNQANSNQMQQLNRMDSNYWQGKQLGMQQRQLDMSQPQGTAVFGGSPY